MKCSLVIALTILGPILTQAVLPKHAKHQKPGIDRPNERMSHGAVKLLKDHRHELYSPIPTYSHGVDYPVVKHSVLKPFVVDYPVKSVPIGIKVPLRPNNAQGQQSLPFKNYGVFKPNNGRPLRPAWPTNCHPMRSEPHPTPVVPIAPVAPVAPIAPTGPLPLPPVAPITPTFSIAPTPAVHIQPAPVSPIFPLPSAPIPLIPRPILKPLIPVAHHQPVAPFPTIIKPGGSFHTSVFATFPKHHLAPLHPVQPLQPLPLSPVPIAPLHPTPIIPHHPTQFVPYHPAPIAPFHPAPIAPFHPGPIVPLHQQPLPVFNQHIPVVQPPLKIAPYPLFPNKFAINPLHALQHNPLNVIHPEQPLPVNHFNAHPAPLPFNFGFHNQPVPTHNIPEPTSVNEQPNNAWTPMTASAAPNAQFQHQFNNEAQFLQHQEDQNEDGYHYRQNSQFDVNQQVQQSHDYNQYDDQYSNSVQHEPQLPQAFPDHPLSGRPINEAFQEHIPQNQHLPLSDPAENFAGYP